MNDIGAVLAMGKQFFDAAGWPEVAAWDETSVATTLRGLISDALPGGLLVAESDGRPIGMLGFMAFPFYFNLAATVAQEMFWWIEPEHRHGVGALLLDAFEQAGRAKGATVFIVSAVTQLRSEVLARLYRRRGYRAAENTFIKRSAR